MMTALWTSAAVVAQDFLEGSVAAGSSLWTASFEPSPQPVRIRAGSPWRSCSGARHACSLPARPQRRCFGLYCLCSGKLSGLRYEEIAHHFDVVEQVRGTMFSRAWSNWSKAWFTREAQRDAFEWRWRSRRSGVDNKATICGVVCLPWVVCLPYTGMVQIAYVLGFLIGWPDKAAVRPPHPISFALAEVWQRACLEHVSPDYSSITIFENASSQLYKVLTALRCCRMW